MIPVGYANAYQCRQVPPVEDEMLGATFHDCAGARCAHFRLMPLICDGPWTEAVKQAAHDLNDTSPSRAKAAAHVNKNRATYGLPTIPTHGYCGLAGKPEVM